MVVIQRTDLGRNRILYFLTIILAMAAMVTAVSLYPRSSEGIRLSLIVLGGIGLVSLALSLLQLYGAPGRSHVLLVHQGDDMIIATNTLDEGFKLRFLRDALTENISSFTDAQRARWKFLEADGYYPALYVRNPRKVLVLRLCTMIFDDVFAVDASNRWEHHDSSSTSEPSFAKGEMPRLKAWGNSFPNLPS